MLISLNWLQDHVDLAGLSTAELSDILTFAGVEVEGIEVKGISTDKVVVAEIKAAEQHPNADRLKVCQVDAGEGALRQIVCGATNYKVGDKVPCALPGATLPAGFTIGETKMRGVESRGMLCAASELGLAEDSDGLMILPADWVAGSKLADHVESDTIFEIEVTPNRPDLLSHFGMAREVAALTGRALKNPGLSQPATSEAGDAISLDGQEICKLYTAQRFTGVKVTESPQWLRAKLESIGLRPINNVVDITNFILHEFGQPLHAFDAAKVSDGLRIRSAKDGESFQALDGDAYPLLPTDCVISDESGAALALGGVMGGEDSGVTESTTDIILESAWFHPPSIRATSRRLNLMSDSSYRFERGVDPGNVLPASAAAAKLIQELASGTPAGQTRVRGTEPVLTQPVQLDVERLSRMVGGSISLEDASAALERLGLTPLRDNKWEIPSYRSDLQRHVDLAEEVVRVAGLNAIPSRLQARPALPSATDDLYDQSLDLKKQLVALGFFEAQTIKLISDEQTHDALPLRPLQDGDLIRVSLPLSEDHTTMRPSMASGLLATASRNARQGAKSLRFFESGRCFRNAGGGKATDLETEQLGLLMSGEAGPSSWNTGKSRGIDAFDLKGVLTALLPGHRIQLESTQPGNFLLTAKITVDGKPLGAFSQLAPSRGRQLDLDAPVYLAELDLNKLLELRSAERKVRELPQFPGSTRDAAIDAPVTLTNAEIEKVLTKQSEPLLVSSTCFDLYRDPSGEKLPADRKSIAYSFFYRHPERTLTGEEVDQAHAKILEHLKKSLPISFR
ncbi:MAG: phenylalanine--tRNA ligase subunit beta [Verrucomicrobia bacterium]|nr:phenylalanine--tRNA ligase subunit beta [Verrucomicrobiota bacterium]MDA1007121.1 phenylalanine--tRNA ligase subunit beta [Verrucomicrobiota bacterium]